MRRTFVSAVTAACLTLGIAGAINVASAVVAPTTAHAGVLGKIKSAAKSFGGAAKAAGNIVKTTGKGIGGSVTSAGKDIGGAAKTVGKTVGKGAAIGGKAVGKAAVVTGKAVGQRAAGTGTAAVKLGKQIAKIPPIDGVRKAVRAVRTVF